MCGRRRQAGGRNLYITRACADVWKGARQLVCELTVLSFSLFFSLSFSLSLSRAVRFVSVSFGLALSVPFGLAFAVPFGFVLVFRSIWILPPFHSVSSSCSLTFGFCLRSIRFILRVPFHSDLVYAAAYLSYP